MKLTKKIMWVIWLCFSMSAQAQLESFKKDSLQIKVYAIISYDGKTPKNIDVTTVFCEYCTEVQKKFLRMKAWKEAYRQRNTDLQKIKNGKMRLALYIRVHREEFRKLNNDE